MSGLIQSSKASMGYLHKMMGGGSSSKSDDRVTVKGHSRGKPTLSPSYSGGPDNKPNPAMKSASSHKMGGNNETKPGAATAASRAKSGAKSGSMANQKSPLAALAGHEAGESASYEKMEEKTLKGLKGSKDKVLSEGHNTDKSMKLGGGGRFAAIKAKAAKSGAKNPAAVAAAAGIKKYGKAKMAKMAAAGRKKG